MNDSISSANGSELGAERHQPHPPGETLDAVEMRFAYKVDAAGQQAAITYPGAPVTVLFDVEYTIGEPDFDRGTEVIVRPGFLEAVSMLDRRLGSLFDLGICTTRAQETLARELHRPTYLESVRHKIGNTRFLVGSTSRIEDADPWLRYLRDEATPAEIADAAAGIVDREILEATRRGEICPSIWYDPKIILVARMAAEHPERVFILVDDLNAARVIRPDYSDPDHPKVIGVCVGDERRI